MPVPAAVHEKDGYGDGMSQSKGLIVCLVVVRTAGGKVTVHRYVPLTALLAGPIADGQGMSGPRRPYFTCRCTTLLGPVSAVTGVAFQRPSGLLVALFAVLCKLPETPWASFQPHIRTSALPQALFRVQPPKPTPSSLDLHFHKLALYREHKLGSTCVMARSLPCKPCQPRPSIRSGGSWSHQRRPLGERGSWKSGS